MSREKITARLRLVGIVADGAKAIEMQLEPDATISDAITRLLEMGIEALKQYYSEDTNDNYLVFIRQGVTLDIHTQIQDNDEITVFPIIEGG